MSRNLISGVAAALAVGFATHIIDLLLVTQGIRPSTDTLLDDFAIGAFAGLAVFLLMVWKGEQEARLRQRLILIAELNYQVRQALAVAAQCAEHPDMRSRLQNVAEAADRIEWVLDEVAPAAAAPPGEPLLRHSHP